MSIVKTEAFILSDIAQGETSKILRVYTKEYGRVSLIAKGARKLKSRFGGSLDPLNHVHIVFYCKKNRDLQLITQCDIINSYSSVKSQLEKLSLGLSIAEIIMNLVIEEESNNQMFELINRSLSSLEIANKNFNNVYWYFLTRFLQISGYGMSVKRCQVCGGEVREQSELFSMAAGGVMCHSCSPPSPGEGDFRISAELVQVMKFILEKEPGQLHILHVSKRSTIELNELFEKYFRYHIEGYTSPQAVKLFI